MSDFFPNTLVDWAHILGAISTTAAVIVSLWLAYRQTKPDIKITCFNETEYTNPEWIDFLYPGELEACWPKQRLCVNIVSVGMYPVTITKIGINHTFPKQLFENKLPCSLSCGEIKTFNLLINPNPDPFYGDFMVDNLNTRNELNQLRLVVETSNGASFYRKLEPALLDVLWRQSKQPQEPTVRKHPSDV